MKIFNFNLKIWEFALLVIGIIILLVIGIIILCVIASFGMFMLSEMNWQNTWYTV